MVESKVFGRPAALIATLILVGVVVLLLLWRRLAWLRLERRFVGERIVLASFGVAYHAPGSRPGGSRRGVGSLVLLPDALYHGSRLRGRELLVPAATIVFVGASDVPNGRHLRRAVLVVRFLNEEGKEEVASFRVPISRAGRSLSSRDPRNGAPSFGTWRSSSVSLTCVSRARISRG